MLGASARLNALSEHETVERVVTSVGLASLLESGPETSNDVSDHVEHRFEDERLIVETSFEKWDLAAEETCREVIVSILTAQDATELVVETSGLRRYYSGVGIELLSAAGRFVDQLGETNERLVTAAKRDPLAVIEELETRTGTAVNVGHESGLLGLGLDPETASYEGLFPSLRGLSIAGSFCRPTIPETATLTDMQSLSTGSTVRVYERPDGIPLYALDLVDLGLTKTEREQVVAGYEAIANGKASGSRSASRAMNIVTTETFDPKLTTVLRKHTRGYGILEDLFSDSRVSDVYATSPVSTNPLRVIVDGELMATNVQLTERGAASIASRIRHQSGRAFSRASPAVDSTADLDCGTGIRMAGITDPVTTGTAFAFREKSDDKFTLPGLVANETMSAEVAAFLSVAIEKNAAALVAGTRGAGKTTLLGTLLYELAADTRTVVIEDTPELPVDSLQGVNRDVQAMRTGTGTGPEISPADALRTALRLGDGALVVGEIRGEEAQVLYEAMRVGANANAVLGTIHGDGAEDIYERVVSDLNVPPSSFGTTDLVITCQAYQTESGRIRRLSAIEEVITSGEEIVFAPLYTMENHTAVPTGRIDRGESRFVNKLTDPGESYSDIRNKIRERTALMERLATEERTSPTEVTVAYATHRLGASR